MADRAHIADLLEECGVLLELQGANPFRCNAYHNAARALNQLEDDLDAIIARGELKNIKGVGATMAEKIVEAADTGELEFLKELRQQVPAGLVEMLAVRNLGPKRIQQVHSSLGVASLAELKLAAEDGRLAKLKGFGPKLISELLKNIEFAASAEKRVLGPTAAKQAETLRDALAAHPSVRRLEICGSLRRRAATIKDIDLLAVSDDPSALMEAFIKHPDVADVTGHGPTKSSVILKKGMAADLRVVSEKNFPFALHYFTGSKNHNVRMRARAQELGLKLNEYELAGGGRDVACADEAALFAALGMTFVPPELREDTGEIEAALAGALPKLIEPTDIQGVFHCHTTESDGRNRLEEMVEAARAAGYSYLGIADHSQSARYANGLSPERVAAQQRRIDELNQQLDGFRVFKGIESDIRADGSLDYDEDVLATFDYVVASLHDHLTMDRDAMTARVLKAIRHPRCTMLGHPTARLLLRREPVALDLEKVLAEAAKHGVLIEINANPVRLDLDWTWCKRAKAMGVMLVINPDAHAVDGFADMAHGVAAARRGWLTSAEVFNTRDGASAAAFLARRRLAADRAS